MKSLIGLAIDLSFSKKLDQERLLPDFSSCRNDRKAQFMAVHSITAIFRIAKNNKKVKLMATNSVNNKYQKTFKRQADKNQ